jgi:hypothetical protein
MRIVAKKRESWKLRPRGFWTRAAPTLHMAADSGPPSTVGAVEGREPAAPNQPVAGQCAGRMPRSSLAVSAARRVRMSVM